MTIEHHGKEIELPGAAPFQRYEFFATGDYGNTDRDDILKTVGFNDDVWAGTLGFEYRLCREALWGLAVTGVEGDTEFGHKVGSVDLTGYAVTTYLSAIWKNLYFDALYSYGRFDLDFRRNTLFGGAAHASPGSNNHAVFLNLGYNLELGRLITGPFAALEYANADINAYTETGASRFNVRVAGQNFDSVTTRVGWQASIPFRTGFGSVTPQVRGAWVHRSHDNDEPVTASLRESPFVLVDAGGARRVGGFSASGMARSPERDALSVGGGVMTKIGDRFSLSLDYEVQLAQSDNFQQFASVRASFAF
jgi:outer membrane autotransporter protein